MHNRLQLTKQAKLTAWFGITGIVITDKVGIRDYYIRRLSKLCISNHSTGQAYKTTVGTGDWVGTAARLGSYSNYKSIKDHRLQKADNLHCIGKMQES